MTRSTINMTIGLSLILFALLALMLNNWMLYSSVNKVDSMRKDAVFDQQTKTLLELKEERVDMIKSASLKNEIISYACLVIGLGFFVSGYMHHGRGRF